jgi:MFS transporter, Spinster family, sphingosine-1-phosphate transporter
VNATATEARRPRVLSDRYAWYALTVLSFINLVNYLDRSVLAPVLDSVKESFAIDDNQAGFLTTAFFWVYTIASPLSGYLGDRVSRRLLIVTGIGLWSLATVASAFARTYEQLWIARAFTGVGEAGYGIVAPAFLGDLFSKEKRSRTLSIFYLALPVGTAAGYAYGGYMVEHFGHAPGDPHRGFLCSVGLHEGWRYAFLFGGIPGLLLCGLAAFLVDPPRGAKDALSGELDFSEFRWSAIGSLLRTPSFVANVAATTAMTFAIGGLQQWAPAFVQRVHHYTPKEGSFLVGIVVALTGTAGTVFGGFLADYARRWTSAAHFIVPGITLVLSALTLAPAVLLPGRGEFWALASISIFLLFCNSGPLNAAILNVSPPAVRATAFAITIFTIHLLGDALSPKLIGSLSDHFAPRHANESLRYAFLIAPPVMLLGGVILLAFARHLPRDVAAVEKAIRASSRGAPGAAEKTKP